MSIATLECGTNGSASEIAKPVFLETMTRVASTVCIVTSECAGFCPGRTVTAAFSLSAEPPLILVSIKTDSSLVDTIRYSEGFYLAMLAEGQELIAAHSEAKLSRRIVISLESGGNGCPAGPVCSHPPFQWIACSPIV